MLNKDELLLVSVPVVCLPSTALV